MPAADGLRPPGQEDDALARRVRRARGTISWRPERGAYFVRWVAPDGTRKQLRGGRTIAEANAALAAVFDDERREAGGQPAERLLHEFLADEHLPALMARLVPKVFLTRKSRLLAVAKRLGTTPVCEVRQGRRRRATAPIRSDPLRVEARAACAVRVNAPGAARAGPRRSGCRRGRGG